MKQLTLWMLAAALFASAPAGAGAEGQSISMDDIADQRRGDAVVVSGHSSYEEVIVKVVRPDGTVLFLDAADVEDGAYSVLFTLPDDAPEGTYHAVAGVGGNVASEAFALTVPGSGGDSGGGIGGEGGGLPAPDAVVGDILIVSESVNAAGKTVTKVTVDAERLARRLAELGAEQGQAPRIELLVPAAAGAVEVELPASAFAGKGLPNQAIIVLRTSTAWYELPVGLLAEALSSGASGDADVVLTMETIEGADLDRIAGDAAASGIELLSGVVEFRLEIVTNGERRAWNRFGNTYVTRTILLDGTVDPDRATALAYDPASRRFVFVPAVFARAEDGKTVAVMKRNGNSLYVVGAYEKSFADIAGHWAQEDVEFLAAKRLVEGVSETRFDPDGNVTRAQFAALLVRSLGLEVNGETAAFPDVRKTDWHAGAIGAAAEARLIAGFEDGTFRPDGKISREQMASMLSRALAFTGRTAGEANAEAALSRFADRADIGAWAAPAVAEAVQAGILSGFGDGRFAPADDANRAQAAVMLVRLLQYLEFIN